MDKTEAFQIWAPPGAVWSPWAKPILFAEDIPSQTAATEPVAIPQFDLTWVPGAGGQTAIVIDLPGELSVELGLALAARGYRPVPLYNSAPGPNAVVEAGDIQQILLSGAAHLQSLSLPPDAPPAFLLDSLRLGHVSLSPGRFDNRWMVFPEDFPSANFLLSCGFGCVVLVQEFVAQPHQDLAHVLLRWQEARLSILAYGLRIAGPFQPISIKRPNYFKKLWYRALVMAGLRRHSGGGFGAVVPDPEADSGYG